MAADIGKGDWMECASLAPRGEGVRGHGFVIGRIYQVSVVHPYGGLDFVGAMRAPSGFGWKRSRFRPIYRPKADLIESLRAPVTRTPKVVREISREDA